MKTATGVDVYRMRQTILENLWHYQQKHHPNDKTKRWTFMIGNKNPLYPIFAQALLILVREGLVEISPLNKQCFLTDNGYEYCQSKGLKLSPEDRFFEDY